MYQVVKRDGDVVDFDLSKISAAIQKAFDATESQYTPDIIDFIALKVTADFQPKIKDNKVAVEDILDRVHEKKGSVRVPWPVLHSGEPLNWHQQILSTLHCTEIKI